MTRVQRFVLLFVCATMARDQWLIGEHFGAMADLLMGLLAAFDRKADA
jgi:hypothetical protein